MSTRFLIVSLLLLAAAGCSSDTPTESRSDLLDRVWRLEAFETPTGDVPVPSDQRLDLRLVSSDGDDERGSAFVTADCNSCAGSWQLGPGASAAIDVGCTEMACGDDSLGMIYEDALAAADGWSRSGDRLWLHDESAGESLRFVPEP